MQVWCAGKLVGGLRMPRPPTDNIFNVIRMQALDYEADDFDDVPKMHVISLPVDRRSVAISQIKLEYYGPREAEEFVARFLADHKVDHATLTVSFDYANDEKRYSWRVLTATIDQLEEIFDLDDFEPVDTQPYRDLAM